MNNVSNSVQLIGRLGAKPEMIALDSGNKLAKLSLATNEVYKNPKGEKVVSTQWHKCIAWGKVAENMVSFLDKGQEVAVQGKITYKNYTNKDGKMVYYTEIVINEFMMVGRKSEAGKTLHAAN